MPVPDPLTAPFWEAAAESRLVVQRCRACRRFQHPPVGICPDCLSTDLAFEPVSGRGRIVMYTITHDARHPAFEALQPYVVALIELEEQADLVMLSNVPGTPPELVRSGLPVEVDFEELAPGVRIPQFRVAARSAAGATA